MTEGEVQAVTKKFLYVFCEAERYEHAVSVIISKQKSICKRVHQNSRKLSERRSRASNNTISSWALVKETRLRVYGA